MDFRLQIVTDNGARVIFRRVAREQILSFAKAVDPEDDAVVGCARKSSRQRDTAKKAPRANARRFPGRYAMTNHSSPSCVTTFADGEVIRMTAWSATGKLDLGRGIRLARVAYQNRVAARLHKRGQLDPDDPVQCEPPTITALHFEAVDGKNTTTTKFTADQIAEALEEMTEATNDPR
jgi:ribosomal protein L32